MKKNSYPDCFLLRKLVIIFMLMFTGVGTMLAQNISILRFDPFQFTQMERYSPFTVAGSPAALPISYGRTISQEQLDKWIKAKQEEIYRKRRINRGRVSGNRVEVIGRMEPANRPAEE